VGTIKRVKQDIFAVSLIRKRDESQSHCQTRNQNTQAGVKSPAKTQKKCILLFVDRPYERTQ